MRQAIEVDDEVLAELGRRARPFVDVEPNSVIRRLLGFEEEDSGEPAALQKLKPLAVAPGPAATSRAGRRRPAARKQRKRAARGSLLDERAYELPILQTLAEHGGRAAAGEVIQRVGELVDDQLTELDRESLETGGIRWQKRIQFARLRMKEQGLIVRESPRGIWEITDQGRQRLDGTTTAAA